MRACRSRGFTLVEILVMIIIVGILVAVAIPNFSGAQDRTRNSGVQHNLHLIQTAVEEYGSDISHAYPDKLSQEFVGKQNDYLPGDAYPATPWNKQQAPGADLPFDAQKNGYDYREPGKIEDPVSTASYGAISFGIGPGGSLKGQTSQQYLLGGTGKKGNNAIRVLTVQNH